MKYNKLGKTDLSVSRVCLGTMTFGEQNNKADGFEQLDFGVSRGINFIDTAELYSIPPRPETQGATESIIGDWMRARKNRAQMVVATKVVGRSTMKWFRGEEARLSRRHINEAVEQSLERLGTDYIDLYQLHWPDREVAMFGSRAPATIFSANEVSIMETLSTLYDLVDEGKIRYIGVSNETSWGVHSYLSAARELQREPIVSIQNPYNLLNRCFEEGLAEFSLREHVGLLAYSPLAQGYLTGKYLNSIPKNSRKGLFDRMSRYESRQSLSAIEAYCDLAKNHGLSPTELAQAFVMKQPFLSSNIIGATTLTQLDECLRGCDIALSKDLVDEIEKIHRIYPNPAP